MILQNYSIGTGTAQQEKPKKHYSLQGALIYLLYIIIAFMVVASFIYSQKVLKNIEDKKRNLDKLEQAYQNIILENEKLDLLLYETKYKNYQGKEFLKITGSLNLKKEAERIVKDYNEKNESPWRNHSKILFWTLFGIILLGATRLIYLDFFNKKMKMK